MSTDKAAGLLLLVDPRHYPAAAQIACEIAATIEQQKADIERLRTALRRIWDQDGKGMNPQEFYDHVTSIAGPALGYRKDVSALND